MKKHLAVQHPHDIDAYIEGKTAFIVQILSLFELDTHALEPMFDANKT